MLQMWSTLLCTTCVQTSKVVRPPLLPLVLHRGLIRTPAVPVRPAPLLSLHPDPPLVMHPVRIMAMVIIMVW
jgi:hypothetical protein